MRVLLVTSHYPPDLVSGATLLVERLATGLDHAGHDVAVVSGAIGRGLADGETEIEKRAGVAVHWIGTAERVHQDDDRNWRNDAARTLVADLVDTWRPDVVHAHTLQTLGATLLEPALAADRPVVVTMHDYWWWCARLFLVDTELRSCPLADGADRCPCARDAAWRARRAEQLAAVLTRADQVLVPSASMARTVAMLGGTAEVDENGIATRDLDRAPTGRADDTVIDTDTDTDTGTVRFLYVGGDSPLKGRDVLLGAAQRLRRRRGWTLDLYGVERPARSRRRWRDRPPDAVGFHPPFASSAAAAVIGRHHVVVIPSIARESFSIVAREALACGRAVITSDCGGPTDVVIHGVNGLVVPVGDEAALADAIAALSTDAGLLRRLMAGAAASAPARTIADQVAGLADRYQRLAGDPTEAGGAH
ncbi:MAG: glycosyltransferase [Desertimonas sp.]